MAWSDHALTRQLTPPALIELGYQPGAVWVKFDEVEPENTRMIPFSSWPEKDLDLQ